MSIITFIQPRTAQVNLLLTTLALLMLFFVVSRAESQKASAFTSFWGQFKAAVAKNDRKAVLSMTKFPFLDGEQLSEAAFLKRYSRIFNQKARKCFARAKPVKDGTSYSVFCGDLIYLFDLVDGKYKFIEIGAND